MDFNPDTYILPLQSVTLRQKDKVLGPFKYQFYRY